MATSLVVVGPAAVGQSTTGPVNLGFEDGVLGGQPTGWTAAPTTDGATVVDVEDGTDSPTYAATGKVIATNNGVRMLRLGTPKDVAETQPTGPTTVTQAFSVPDGDTVVVAARILSWEFRDLDRIAFRAEGARLVESVSFFPGASQRSCPASTTSKVRGKDVYAPAWACEFAIVGTKGVLLDSNWQVLRLAPLPDADTDPDRITLSYTVEGTLNSSHATWAYFDDVNRPPVAQFTSEPPAGELVYEGSLVQLRDASYDPDEPDDIVEWQWTVTPPSGPVLTSDVPDPSFVPPDDGPYRVQLDATSTDGRTRTATRDVDVSNTPALVNALDVEVLTGQPAPLLARFLDAGWLDTHSVMATSTTAVGHDLDAAPGLARGRVTGTIAAGATSSVVTVDDGDGPLAPTSTDTAKVTVVANNPMHGEGDDTIETARPATANASRLGWIQTPGDVDVVEVKLEGAAAPQPLLAGTEVVVALDDVPADLDVVVFALAPGGTETAPYQMAPYQMAPYQMAPYQMAPYQMATIERAPYQMAPYQMAPYQMADLGLSPYQMAPYQMAPYQMAPYQMAPLSTDPYVTGDVLGSGTGGGDIDAAELGVEKLLQTTDGLQVAGFSANRGLADETVLVRVDRPGTRLFAAVLGANGVASAQPYRLRLESSVPFSALALAATEIHEALDATVCAGTALVPGPQSRVVMDHSDGTPETLIVTQLDRLRARAGTEAEWNRFLGSLETYAQQVDARIVSVADGAAYESWDTSPCSVAAANAVTELVRDEVRAQVDPGGDGQVDVGWEYLVVLGDDTVVPFRRTTTGVVIGDEAQYLGGSFLRPGSPLAAALATSQELTDDFLSDLQPQAFQSGELYLPDLATGRLVETPSEIADQLDAFVVSGGRLDASTALVTAHDFLADGGDTIAASLASAFDVTSDTTDTWDADDLRCRWLGDAEACADGEQPGAPDIVSPNSHWTHYASLSAEGYTLGDLGDVLTSEQVGATPSNTGRQLVFTVGCHAGFSVPDAQSLDGTAYGIDPKLDFAQALARRNAVFVASTGFGLGETEGLAGTELLMAIFADQLLDTTLSAGQALRAAKATYLGALSTVSTYDVKSLVQQAMYGPPQYRVAEPDTSTVAPASVTSAPATATDGTLTFAPTMEQLDDGRRYWTIDGDVQITPGRPWQPRVVRSTVGTDVRGALITGGSLFPDVTNVPPVVTRPTMEWETDPEDLDVCHRSWWPADLVTVTDDALVLVPGQFRCTNSTEGSSSYGNGTQRLYKTLTLELLESTSADRTPPRAGPLDIRGVDGGIELSFPASDASGIARIVPLLIDPTTGAVRSIESSTVTPDAAGRYRVVVTDLSGSEEFVVQVADGAGNVTTLTGRGANLRHLAVTASSPVLATPGTPTAFTATIPSLETTVAPVQYIWEFGDGTTVSGTVTSSPFTVTHTYGDDLWTPEGATLRVWDADGATGTVDVRVIRRCDHTGDAYGNGWADLVGCDVEVSGTTAAFTLRLAAPVSAAGSYRIEITTGTSKKPVTTKLKYDHANASYSGAKSLVATVEDGGHSIVYRLDIADLGVRRLTGLTWFAEVQSGISGVPTAGFVDRMPDAGSISWTAPAS